MCLHSIDIRLRVLAAPHLIIMAILQALRSAKTLEDLASLLGFKAKAIAFILYVKPPALSYRVFSIPKKSGGMRRIASPSEELKLLQQRLGSLLLSCREEIESENFGEGRRNQFSHAFLRDRSIFTNASRHRHRRYVFNLDLADFFDSINFGRVRGFFIKDWSFALQPKIATIIAQIACWNNCLPQGSPSSPIISELVARILDKKLIALAKRAGCAYSRYADDLTFSTNKSVFPGRIAVAEGHGWNIGSELRKVIRDSGFQINDKKTRMQYRDSRQLVTGLVVNKVINVRKEYRKLVRALVHRLLKVGEFTVSAYSRKGTELVLEKRPGKVNELHGMLGFINQSKLSETSRRGIRIAPNADYFPLFRRFLLFKELYAAELPVIICEGKTDNVYLTHALRSLASSYPDLATVDANGKVVLKVRRFRYTERSTGKILGIHGGGGDLKNLVRSYFEESKRFTASKISAPVIVLVDNDSGAKPVFNVVKELLGKNFERSEPFSLICKNLYLMATPLTAGRSESKIEDFFEVDLLQTKVEGRTFDPSGKNDPRAAYGKAEFAYKVVEKRSAEISFEGFRPLLNNLVALIRAFKQSRTLE